MKKQELMSQKEKDYIASCFNKTAASLKTEIDYEAILEGERIEYDLKDDKKAFKIIFGKAFRRSRKQFRPSSNTEADFMAAAQIITQLYETLNILKYIKIDEETCGTIELAIAEHFTPNFNILIENNKILKFLSELFAVCTKSLKLQIMHCFFINSDKITNLPELYSFLDKNIQNIPVAHYFIDPKLWSNTSGCLLALFVLLKEPSTYDKIINAFLQSQPVECEYLGKFVSVLFSLCDEDQRKSIIEKLKKQNISNVICDLSKLKMN